jgi:hypothetical protein
MSFIYKNKTGLVRSSVLKAGRFLTMLVLRSLTKNKSLCCIYYSLTINFFIFHFNLVFLSLHVLLHSCTFNLDDFAFI